MAGSKTIVRLTSGCVAVLVIVLYAGTVNRKDHLSLREADAIPVHHRKLLGIIEDPYEDSIPSECKGSGGTPDQDNANCTQPLLHGNESCSFITENCQDDVQLVDYLGFVACDLPNVKPLGFVILAFWLLYLISLLATTADYFFVPPLYLISDKLKLSPSIAGITFLAIGNGAPDVFTAFSALKNGDLPLVLGALIGASIFISTVVLGSVILITKVTSETIDKIDFVRDVVAYMIVVGAVIGIAFDGTIYLYEAILFPLIYVGYIATAVTISYIRKWWAKRKLRKELVKEQVVNETEQNSNPAGNEDNNTSNVQFEGAGTSAESVQSNGETTPLLNGETTPLLNASDDRGHAKQQDIQEEKERLELPGLTWPRGQNILVKIQWVIEYPFSVLRWLSIPPCCHDGQWTLWHRGFIICSPVPMIILLTIAGAGWSGFTSTIGNSSFPIVVLFVILGVLSSIVLLVVDVLVHYYLKPKGLHWALQLVVAFLAFVTSIAWLNIEANEVVSILESFGLAFNIDTAILGLTVLAIGNSVGDWIADTAVARAGQPGMGVASCFGSPLLNDVLGLSFALIAKIGFYDGGKPFIVCIHNPEYTKVKLSWIFLSISLVMSALVFPLFKFSPPRAYGIVLIYIYIVFMVFSVLDEVNVLKFYL